MCARGVGGALHVPPPRACVREPERGVVPSGVGNKKLTCDEEGADCLGGTEHGAGGSDEHFCGACSPCARGVDGFTPPAAVRRLLCIKQP